MSFINFLNNYILNPDNLVGFPKPFAMSGGLPLDIDSIKITLNDLNTYVNTAGSSAHPGKLVVVIGDTTEINNGVYIINKVKRYDEEGLVTKLLGLLGDNVSKLFELVSELPDEGESGVIYLIQGTKEDGSTGYYQHIYKNNNWVEMGFISLGIDLIESSGALLKILNNCTFVEWLNKSETEEGYHLDNFITTGLYFIYGKLSSDYIKEMGFPESIPPGDFTAYLQVINNNSNVLANIYGELCKQILITSLSGEYIRKGIRQFKVSFDLNEEPVYYDFKTTIASNDNTWFKNFTTEDIINDLKTANISKALSAELGRILNNKITEISNAEYNEAESTLILHINITNGTNS